MRISGKKRKKPLKTQSRQAYRKQTKVKGQIFIKKMIIYYSNFIALFVYTGNLFHYEQSLYTNSFILFRIFFSKTIYFSKFPL